MNAQIINASYNPLQNQITFPAGILQPPFFDPNADPAVNYGAIGAVIGHEIGHGFDDQGRRFDPQGRVRDWWSDDRRPALHRADDPARRSNMTATGRCPTSRSTAQLTMGENIGDLGGLEMAYAAYRRHVAQHGEPPVIDGLTGDQRFFLAWAQVWRSKDREGFLRQRVLTDPHSPDEFRINGAVRNIDAWYRAFNVQPGDRHVPAARAARAHLVVSPVSRKGAERSAPFFRQWTMRVPGAGGFGTRRSSIRSIAYRAGYALGSSRL